MHACSRRTGCGCSPHRLPTTSSSSAAQKPLEDVLRYAEEKFAPDRMAVIGTCVSMIIGEDLQSAIDSAGITTPTIAVDIHAGYIENIAGVLSTLEAAEQAGWITFTELERQRFMMGKATEVERLRGAACQSYIEPSRGDLKHKAAGTAARACPERETGSRDPEREEGDRVHVCR